MAKQDYRVTGEVGVPCIRCGKPTEVREHKVFREKHSRQPYYFSKWFNCNNKDCKVTIFMKEEYKVWNNNNAAQVFKTAAQTMNQLDDFEEELDAKINSLF